MGTTEPAIAGLDYPVLIGDIGGTNARFALLEDELSDPVEFPIAQTADYHCLEEAIQKTVLDRTPIHPKSAILAVAGMVFGEEIPLTNAGWFVRPGEMLKALRLGCIIVLNDFEAQALAVLALDFDDMEQIGGHDPQPGLPCAVLGPGTGLGVAGLVHHNGAWLPLAGEGGHIDIGPRNERETAIFRQIAGAGERVSGEQVLSGPGLMNVYLAICAVDGRKPELKTPRDVSAAGLAKGDPAACEALSLFVTILGRVAGDIALVFMSSGGVYLTGGIARKILPALKQPGFRQAFEDKAPHGNYLATLPVKVVTHPLAALVGIAAYARSPSMFGLDISKRCWSTEKS